MQKSCFLELSFPEQQLHVDLLIPFFCGSKEFEVIEKPLLLQYVP